MKTKFKKTNCVQINISQVCWLKYFDSHFAELTLLGNISGDYKMKTFKKPSK